MDPGIGAGPLASHALSRKIELGATNPLADITGIDIDEVAIAMASVSLKLVDGAGKSNLIQSDFIQHSPRSFEREGIQTEAYDAVIANPPYSRHQALDSQMKEDLEQIIARESTYDFSQRTPLYGYFLVHAAQFLRSGGRIAAIVPSKFLDTEFGRDLKRYLLNEFTIHGIVQFGDEIDVFEGIRTRPSVLLLEKGTAPESHQTRFMRVSSWAGNFDAETLLDTDPEEITGVSGSTVIAQRLLSPAERWSYYLDETDVRDFPELTEFDEIATPHRGIATGDNDYFCLTQDVVEEYDIPERYRVKIIRSAHGLDLVNLTEENWESWRDDGESVWLLYCLDSGAAIEKDDLESDGLRRYLSEGEDSETVDRYIVSNRSTWYRVEPQEPAPILGKYMNRTGFLFMRNDAELRTLNNIHAIYLDFDEDDDEYEMYRDALLAYLNSTVMERVLSKESHNYSGLQKLEISQLNGAPVLDPREIDPEKRTRLANLFNDLRRSRQSGNDGHTFIEQIDQELKPLLELDERKST
ncbi:type i restriction-modification system methyltransferase subunit [Halorubrum lipolyticum DSM 21995]|uniref:site-specific DNA-methyltransferase (adenine-specific) n=2 Tax=Halorubrum lipolyticum TaxID=368624 RepID=M0P3E0_9EURY|nr:type i restriction-modification system methyltransferase subunit [Halorubrum lipolyticum DSM 21995]